MNYKYGHCPDTQISEVKEQMRKRIFFLLICADKDFEEKYKDINIPEAIENLLVEFNGLNEVLLFPPEMLRIMGMLTSAKNEYLKDDFNFQEYRRLVLGAGAEVLKIREV
jgi:hypothetical protein